MPKFRSAESLLQLCLESMCKLIIRNSSGNAEEQQVVKTYNTVNDVVDEGNESASKCVASPFEELRKTAPFSLQVYV